jgi:succinyl-diaminopimelate desuccinylase
MTQDPLNLIREDDVVDLTRRLVRIPSQYIEHELVQHHEIAEVLAKELTASGLEVEVSEPIEDYPVVIGTTPGGGEGPTVGVIGHYSTVAIGDPNEWSHDPLGAELIDGRIYGRGSLDQKGAIASVILATRAVLASGVARKGRVRLLLVPGEGCTEMALAPIVRDRPDLVRCDVYLDSDGSASRISLVHGGWVWIELTTRGTGGHAGALTRDGRVPVNPVAKLVHVVYRLQDVSWMSAERHPLFGPEYGRYSRDPIVDINVFNAGSKVNIIPPEARAQIDVRMLPSQSVKGVLGELDRVLDEMRAADADLQVSYEVLNSSKNPHEITPDHPMIQSILQTCRELGEPEPQLVGSIGGGRGTLADMGPVMHFGAGGGVGAHAPDEYALVDRLLAGARLHAHLYEKVLSSAGDLRV